MTNANPSRSRQKAMELEQHLKSFFAKDQGVRFGESCVISTKVHANDAANPGMIQVLINKDAGQIYLKNQEHGEYLHIDVFHRPAKIDPVILGRRIWHNLNEYFTQLRKEGYSEGINEQDWSDYKIVFARQIIAATSVGQGNVYELASDKFMDNNKIILSHVHILAKIPTGFYDFLLPLVEAVETSIIRQSYEIRKVERLVHIDESKVSDEPSLTLPAPPDLTSQLARLFRQHNHAKAVMKMTSALGSVEDAAQLMESMTPTKNIYLGRIKKKHDDLDHTLQELIEIGLIKKGKLFYTLTDQGKEFRDYLRGHQQELELELRKAIRKKPPLSKRYSCFYNSRLKAKKRRLTDRRKVVTPTNNWFGQIALPETIIRSAARNFLGGNKKLSIEKEDIQVYDRKSFAPVDTCLLIDCSGSMVGEKIRAVSQLAEYLILTSREKVAVVCFQEMAGRRVVDFTKNYRKLQDGLRSIVPEGLTPMAAGIMEALETIKESKARNPMLVLITDGLPNYPLWTMDAQIDALTAAEKLAINKIRFVTIGLKPDEKYLKVLSEKAGGNAYIIEHLDKDQMIDIVEREWSQYRSSSRLYRR